MCKVNNKKLNNLHVIQIDYTNVLVYKLLVYTLMCIPFVRKTKIIDDYLCLTVELSYQTFMKKDLNLSPKITKPGTNLVFFN